MFGNEQVGQRGPASWWRALLPDWQSGCDVATQAGTTRGRHSPGRSPPSLLSYAVKLQGQVSSHATSRGRVRAPIPDRDARAASTDPIQYNTLRNPQLRIIHTSPKASTTPRPLLGAVSSRFPSTTRPRNERPT